MAEEKKTMKQEVWLNAYLGFKNRCIQKNIVNLDEIIKLFEVWLNLIK